MTCYKWFELFLKYVRARTPARRKHWKGRMKAHKEGCAVCGEVVVKYGKGTH
jgi:hypothetical protein